MAKITLDPITSGYQSTSQVNNNNADIADHLNSKVLYRDNPEGEPNHMLNPLDMNGNKFLNVPKPSDPTDIVRLQDLDGTVIIPSEVPLVTETVTLTSGQTVAVFATADLTYATFYISGDNADNGRLVEGVDYTVVISTSTVTLSNSYPAGTILTASYNETGTEDLYTRYYDNVEDTKLQNLPIGALVTTKGYTAAGDGGGATYLVAANQVVDGYVDHLCDNSNVLLYQPQNGIISPEAAGALYSVAGYDANVEAMYAYALANSLEVVFTGYIVATSITVPAGVKTSGIGWDKSGFLCANQATDSVLLGVGSYHQFEDLEFIGSVPYLCYGIGQVGGAYIGTMRNVRFRQLLVAERVTNDHFWWNYINVVYRDNVTDVESLVGQKLNASSWLGGYTHHYSPPNNYSSNIVDSHGISFIGFGVQNRGPRFENCNGITARGGYWEGYTVPVLTLVNSQADLNLHPPAATIFSIDNSSYEKGTGNFPANSIYAPVKPIGSTAKNIFPVPTCDTIGALQIAGSLVSGTPFVRTINGSGHVQLDATAAGSAGFVVKGPVSGISALINMRVISGEWKVEFYSASGGVTSANLNQHSDTDWHNIRMHSDVTNDGNVYVRFSTVGTVTGTFSLEIDDAYIVPDAVCIARKPISSTSNIELSSQFLTIDAGIVTIAGAGATATVHTFGATDYGTYLVSSYASNRASGSQRSVSYVIVHSGSVLTIVNINSSLGNHSSAGLALQCTNNGGGAADFKTEIVRLSS